MDKEEYSSGRRGRPGKSVWPKGHREFESRLLRNMVRMEQPKNEYKQFNEHLPTEDRSPPGMYGGVEKYFYPYSYFDAKKTRETLVSDGFQLDTAGIAVATNPYDVQLATGSLSLILNSDMRTQIPSYFMTLTPPKVKDAAPSYITRTVTSTMYEPKTGNASIVQEIGTKRAIVFENQPPYCLFEDVPDDAVVDSEHFFIQEISRRVDLKEDPLHTQNVIILAGLGNSSQPIINNLMGSNKLKVANVKHGSSAMILAMLSMELVEWGSKHSDKSLFFYWYR